jgi:hypothetical protein
MIGCSMSKNFVNRVLIIVVPSPLAADSASAFASAYRFCVMPNIICTAYVTGITVSASDTSKQCRPQCNFGVE